MKKIIILSLIIVFLASCQLVLEPDIDNNGDNSQEVDETPTEDEKDAAFNHLFGAIARVAAPPIELLPRSIQKLIDHMKFVKEFFAVMTQFIKNALKDTLGKAMNILVDHLMKKLKELEPGILKQIKQKLQM